MVGRGPAAAENSFRSCDFVISFLISFYPEIALYPMSGIFRVFTPCSAEREAYSVGEMYSMYIMAKTLLTALCIERSAHFQIGNEPVPSILAFVLSDGHH